jgi:hypothetical protein
VAFFRVPECQMPEYTPGLEYHPGKPIIAGYLYWTRRKGDLVGFRVENVFRGKGKTKALVGRFVAYHCTAQGIIVLIPKSTEDREDGDLSPQKRVSVLEFLAWLNG